MTIVSSRDGLLDAGMGSNLLIVSRFGLLLGLPDLGEAVSHGNLAI